MLNAWQSACTSPAQDAPTLVFELDASRIGKLARTLRLNTDSPIVSTAWPWLRTRTKRQAGVVISIKEDPWRPLSERFEDVFDAGFGVAEEHLGVVAVEEGVLDAGVACSH
ncbi:hypothetical protein GCM10009712_38260 [Pseudarthrobacter sulfonivorans]